MLGTRSRLAALIVAFLLTGCGRVHLGMQDGGGGGRDGGVRDGGAAREPCGRVLCEVGQVCCNASCGLCAAPDLACAAIACTDECSSNADCAVDEYCALPWGTCAGPGVCTARDGTCPTVVSPVCGCDGHTYGNACEAAGAGVPVRSDGECAVPSCVAQDIAGDGICDAELGVRWDGARCEPISGCACAGADCGAIFADGASCHVAYAHCRECAPMDARGEGACALVLGVRWSGSACETLSGCSCAGVDCPALFRTMDDCRLAYAECF